jgi:hypothetical protein
MQFNHYFQSHIFKIENSIKYCEIDVGEDTDPGIFGSFITKTIPVGVPTDNI